MAAQANMTTSEIKHYTSLDIAKRVIEAPDETAIAAIVNELPKADVPLVLARATPIRKAIAAFEKAGEQRIVAEAILGLGEAWVDPETGEVLVFAGAPGENDCQDPVAFSAALIAAGVPQADVNRAIFPVLKVDFRVAKELAKRNVAAQEAFDDHVTRRPNGPPHLKGVK
jgi:hypothetical protein